MSNKRIKDSSKQETHQVAVLGASSMIGPWLVKRLAASGYFCRCFSRQRPYFAKPADVEWHALNIRPEIRFDPGKNTAVVSLLPVWVFADVLPYMNNCRRIIAFSTTSVFGKQSSPNPDEQLIVKKVRDGERRISEYCTRNKISWTILRPALIYDGKSDRNITRMAEFIKRWGVLPVAAPANGLRQPVHADDLAKVVVSIIKTAGGRSGFYNLGGGETLSYAKMCKRVFQALGKKPRIIPIPLSVICLACRIINGLTGGKGPNEAMFVRMNQDLVYDQRPALQNLDYAPRPFYPSF